MVQATDMGQRYNISHLGGFYSTSFRRILIRRYVRSARMIITEVLAKDSTQVPLFENNNMIQTVSTYGPDNSFDERVLPRRGLYLQEGPVLKKAGLLIILATAFHVLSWSGERARCNSTRKLCVEFITSYCRNESGDINCFISPFLFGHSHLAVHSWRSKNLV